MIFHSNGSELLARTHLKWVISHSLCHTYTQWRTMLNVCVFACCTDEATTFGECWRWSRGTLAQRVMRYDFALEIFLYKSDHCDQYRYYLPFRFTTIQFNFKDLIQLILRSRAVCVRAKKKILVKMAVLVCILWYPKKGKLKNNTTALVFIGAIVHWQLAWFYCCSDENCAECTESNNFDYSFTLGCNAIFRSASDEHLFSNLKREWGISNGQTLI